MNNCPECGKPIPAGLQYCPSCIEKPRDFSTEVTAHINLLKRKIEKEPLNAQLHIELADIYHKHASQKQALSEYEKAINANANNFDAQIKSAHIYLKFGETSKAEDAFRAALHISPKSTESLIGLFRTYYLQDRTEEAIALCEKIVEFKPNNIEFHILLKNLYNKKGDKEKAFDELLKLEALSPDSEQFVKEIALHYQKENKMEKAKEYYDKMLNMDIKDIDLGYQIGQYYYDNKKYDKAIEHLNGLLELDNITPERDAMIRVYKALACFDKGDIPEAKNVVDKMQPVDAQELDEETQKKLASLFFRIGQDELKNSKAKKAIAGFEKALVYDDKNAGYRQMLEETKYKAVTSSKKLFRKIYLIAGGTIVAFIIIIFAWILTHNKIIIDIETAEDITILVDGKPVQTKSENSSIISSPILMMGKHNVEIERRGYEKWQNSVSIGFGRSTRLKVALIPIYSFLQITSIPENARVIVDGQFVGKTPFVSDRILTCPHIIELERVGHAKWHTNLVITERDSIDLGIISLKNLAGKWYGEIGKDTYAYNAAFNMTINQTNADLTVKYYHQPREDFVYSGTIYGKIENGEFYAEGTVIYRFPKVFYRAKTKKKIVMQGKISDNWEKIEGKHSIENLAGQYWWASR